MKSEKRFFSFLACVLSLSALQTICLENEPFEQENIVEHNHSVALKNGPKVINDVIVRGNSIVPASAILNYVPYKPGQLFDPIETKTIIENLYFGLDRRLKNISIATEDVSDDALNVYILVEEKYPLTEIEIIGNKHLSKKDILKKTELENISSIDENDLQIIAKKIRQLYLQKGYHQAFVETQLDINNECATAYFSVCEGKKATVKQVHFVGNECVTDKELRSAALTKEDWLLGFLDGSGQYHPDRLEGDKYFIEEYYKNRGYFAKVTDVDVDIDEKTNNIILTFEVEEGELHHIGTVSVPGNEIYPEEFLLSQIPIYPGMVYSKEAIVATIKRLELIWGNLGYIFAHVEPAIDLNEQEHIVNVSFFTELGNKVSLRDLTIRGNSKTRDKVIRRKLLVQEGFPVCQSHMDLSKRNVESLGYFKPQDGVLWKIKRVNDELVDLDLIVSEAKTGHLGAKLGFGGVGADFNSPASGFSVTGEFSDTNLLGNGIHLNGSASWSKDEQNLLIHVAQPWLFDKPILGAFDIYHRRPTYDELSNIDIPAVHEKITGGSATLGYIHRSSYEIWHDVHMLLSGGIDNINYQRKPQAKIFGAQQSTMDEYQLILDQEFQAGKFFWLSTKFEQDTRNHPVHVSRGHRWLFLSKFAVPSFSDNIGFYKCSFDWNWFTPLINEYDLVLRVHAYAGVTAPFKNRTIPYGELFHIGGQNSIRGFLFGQIGPNFQGDSIGGKKALFMNVELIFPITADMSIKGVIFYDGGTGFDNPYASQVSHENIMSNNFDYRHSVGFGLRLLKPMPIRIDWGFKIDPRKDKLDPRRSETAQEVHFGMSYDW